MNIWDEAFKITNLLLGPIRSQIAAISGGGGGGTTPTGTYIVSGGDVVYSGTGLQYNIGKTVYYILGTQYIYPGGSVTLTAADATNPRIDVIYVDSGNLAGVLTGVAASTAEEPNTNPASQIALTRGITVPANATTPPNVITDTLYSEGSEWTPTASGASMVVNSTNSPHSGTKCIEATNLVVGVYAQGVRGSAIDPSLYTQLIFWIKPKAAWTSGRGLRFRLFNGSSQKGVNVDLFSGSYGFDSTNLNYQLVVIPLSLFQVPSGQTVTKYRAAGVGGTIGFYLDDIQFQGGLNNATNAVLSVNGQTGDVRLLVADIPGSAPQTGLDTETSNRTNADAALQTQIDNIEVGENNLGALCRFTTPAAYSYANGTLGSGATVTFTAAAAQASEGITPALNDTVMLDDGTSVGGLYKVTLKGTGVVNEIWTRHVSMDQSAEFGGKRIDVESGSTSGGKAYRCTTYSPTVGTTVINFTTILSVFTEYKSLVFWFPSPAAGQSIPILGIDGGWTVQSWRVIAQAACTISFDLWNDAFANYPPTVADTICGSVAGGVKPALAAALTAESSSLAHWTTDVADGTTPTAYIESLTGSPTWVALKVKLLRAS